MTTSFECPDQQSINHGVPVVQLEVETQKECQTMMNKHHVNVHILGYILQCIICHVFNCWLVCQCVPFTYAIEIFGPSFDFAFLFLCACTVSYMLQTSICVQDIMQDLHWYGRSYIVNQAPIIYACFDQPESENRTDDIRNVFYCPMVKIACVAVFTVCINSMFQSGVGYWLYVGCLSPVLLTLAMHVWTSIGPNTRDNIKFHVKVWSVLLAFTSVMVPAIANYEAYMFVVGFNLIVEIFRVIILRFLFYYVSGPFFSGLILYVSVFSPKHWRSDLLQLAHACLGTIWRFQGEEVYGRYVLKTASFK